MSPGPGANQRLASETTLASTLLTSSRATPSAHNKNGTVAAASSQPRFGTSTHATIARTQTSSNSSPIAIRSVCTTLRIWLPSGVRRSRRSAHPKTAPALPVPNVGCQYSS